MSPTDAPPAPQQQIPPVLWAFALSYLVSQLMNLAYYGTRSGQSVILSVLLGAVIVTLVSYGVVRARPVAFWFVAVLVVLALVFELIGLSGGADLWDGVNVLISGAQVALLYAYRKTEWYVWQRTKPSDGPSLVPVLAIAALVGVLGGVVDSPTVGTDVSVSP